MFTFFSGVALGLFLGWLILPTPQFVTDWWIRAKEATLVKLGMK